MRGIEDIENKVKWLAEGVNNIFKISRVVQLTQTEVLILIFLDLEPPSIPSYWSLPVQRRDVLFFKHSFNHKILQVQLR